MANSDSTHPDFWTARYTAGATPWDFGGVPSALISFLARSPGPGRVLIPGCGSGYEVRAFDEAGYNVTAIDFSPAAVERAGRVLGPLGGRVILGDFFGYDFGRERFDLIYERTFLCSMAPTRWPEYVKRMAEMLSSKGQLVGIFLYCERSDSGPPFPMADADADRLLKREFQLVRSEPVSDSLPFFRNRERWQEWVRV